MIDSVCICLTFKCNLFCRHCFVEAGPNRSEEMTIEEIYTAIDNSYHNVARMYFSGGEVTTVMPKLLAAIRYASQKRDRYGYPRDICIQTNGYFADTLSEAETILKKLSEAGATELDFTSNDSFHYEQTKSKFPLLVAKLASQMGCFKNVMVGGSEENAIKLIGRAKKIPKAELSNYSMPFTHICFLSESDYVIHPNGDVLPCVYGFANILGNIFDESLDSILKHPTNIEILKQMRTGIEAFLCHRDSDTIDICEQCNQKVQKIRANN